MAVCVCGYLHAHLDHGCKWGTPKHGSRPAVPGPRCIGCNTLHAHIPHDCPQRDAKLRAGAVQPVAAFDPEPKTIEAALAQWEKGWRPLNMCKDCPSLSCPCQACWVRAGYPAERYLTATERAALEGRSC